MRCTVFIITILTICPTALHAQHRSTNQFKFRPNDDLHKVALGCFVAGHAQRAHLNFTESYAKERPKSIVSFTTAGVSLGFNVNYRFAPLWEWYAQPQVRFGEWHTAASGDYYHQVQTRFAMPAMVMFKSARRGNFRMFVTAGLSGEIDLIQKERQERGSGFLKLTPYDAQLSLGFGYTRYYRLFNCSPELRFSYGLVDQLMVAEPEFSENVSSMYSRSVSLIFNLGG